MRYKETRYIKYLKDEEFEQIKHYVANRIKSPPTQMCLRVMMFLGLRVGEAIRLKRTDFNYDFSKLIYTPLKQRTTDKKRHERFIPAFLQELLRRYDHTFSLYYREGYLFPPYGNDASSKHISYGCIGRHFMLMRRALKLTDVYHYRKYLDGRIKPLHRISPHTLRHYCCWKYYHASGKDLVFTQRMIGHKKIETTCHYIHSLVNKETEASIVEKAFN